MVKSKSIFLAFPPNSFSFSVNSEVQVYKDQIDELITVKDKLERDLSSSTANLNRKIAEIQVHFLSIAFNFTCHF